MSEPKEEHPTLPSLRERESVLKDKLASLDKLDANYQLQNSVEISEVKRRNQIQLAEVRAEIQKLSK